ncbi:MAG: hypothetical protein VKO64_07395 [Candidatus Sericytochromatia bacterium]|nr:hypothetical protein [Candidatus Sericytochromatia bacterium]
MNRLALLAAVSATLVLGGCNRLTLKADEIPEEKVFFTPIKGAKVVGTLDESQTASWFFWGLTPIGQPDASQALAPRLKAGQRIQNLVIKTQVSVMDAVLSGLTLGIYQQRTVNYTGEIVQ